MAEQEKPRQQKPGRGLGKVGRVEREARYNRYIVTGTVVIVTAVVALVGWAVVNEAVIQPDQPVATVNGEVITTREFQARVRYERLQLVNTYLQYFQAYQAFVGNQTFQAQYLSLMRQIEFQLDPFTTGQSAMDQMIDEVLIRQQAEEMGITVTEEEITQQVDRFFGYFPNGEPTETITPTTAPTSTFSPTQLAIVTITPTATDTPTSTPDPSATPTQAFTLTPTVSVPTFTPEPFTLEDYQTAYVDYVDFLRSEIRFNEDALREVIAAGILRQKVMDAITADLPHEQEQVWARHILVEDEETANEIYERLQNGEDFAALAAEFSIDTSNKDQGGDLGWFSVSTMVQEFAQVAFNTPIGRISEPVSTSFGWHIIQVLGHEDRPLSPGEYEQFREEEFFNWLTTLRAQADIVMLDYWVDRIPDDPDIPAQYRSSLLQQ